MKVITLKYLICNLKANKTYYDMLIYKDNLRSLNLDNLNFILAPSTIYLPLFKREAFNLCIQDIPLYENKNLTGDVSIEQLKSLDVKYAIIAHSERKEYYHETEQNIITKILNALNNNLKVIYCIGETKEELARRVEYMTLERQIARVLNHIPEQKFQDIIIAYEPTYMIGGNTSLDIATITKNICFIKNLIDNYYQSKIKVIYGGNITPHNIQKFAKIKELDGYIIGTSCLDIHNLKEIIANIK